jgi:hypothetical protein
MSVTPQVPLVHEGHYDDDIYWKRVARNLGG